MPIKHYRTIIIIRRMSNLTLKERI